MDQQKASVNAPDKLPLQKRFFAMQAFREA